MTSKDIEAQICGLLAILGERGDAQKAYVARVLAWARDAYLAFNTKADWREALSCYRRSREVWNAFGDAELKTYRPELRVAQERMVERQIARCMRELGG